MEIKDFAIKCFKDEAQAILNLIPLLDDNFQKAVEMIYNCKGKLIVTGVGKSGHVGEKIASTLSVDQFIDQFSEALQTSLTRLGVDPHFMSDPVQRMRLQFYLAGALSLYSTWLTSDHSMPIELVSDTIESAIESSVFPSVVIA